jgi:hypothetical protein
MGVWNTINLGNVGYLLFRFAQLEVSFCDPSMDEQSIGMIRTVSIIFVWNLGVVAGGVLSADEPDSKKIEFFEEQVRPVLVKRCYDCHGEDSVESKLRLDSLAGMLQGGTRGPAIVIGNPKKSLLISAINHSDLLQMPPKDKLPRREIVVLTKWIRMGAAWPNSKPNVLTEKSGKTGPLFTEEEKEFWAFKLPVNDPPPDVKEKKWARSPMDAFVLAKLEAAGFRPAPQAVKRTLIRRATFDLTGLPPTPAEVRLFLADTSPNAFAKVVDRLLDSPRYGERWGRHWLDVARYADSNGLDENLAYANAFRYRDYVIAAFNADKPYDRFVQEQLAGDLITDSYNTETHIEGMTATGFLSIGAKMLAEDDPVKMQMDIIDEQIDTMGRAFMGLTLGCARCHSHKFDPIPTEDYYSLAGIFKSTKTMENFKVVARWQESPLASLEETKRQETHREIIDDKKTEIHAVIQQANNRLLAEERKHLSDYLLAAEKLRQLEELVKQAKTVGPDSKAKRLPGMVLIEAEDFTRGNVQKDFSGYGQGIGVIYNIGQFPNFAEYDLEVISGGLYQLALRYAAAVARPIKLIINGDPVKSDAADKVTGSWNPDTQTWMLEGVFRFKAGKNSIRLERQKPFPHFDKLLIVPARRPDGHPLRMHETKKTISYEPNQEFVRQWAEYLKKTINDAESPFFVWNRFVAGDRRSSGNPLSTTARKDLLFDPQPTSFVELSDRYGKLFADNERDWNAYKQTEAGKNRDAFLDLQKESLRQILYSSDGPFALPKNPESFYADELRNQLKQQRETLRSLEKTMPTYPLAMSVSEGKPQNLQVHIRGSHTTLGKEVPRRFLRIITRKDQKPIDNQRSGRLELARWLSSPAHPLTARVMVNRIWLLHFGEGLVRTPDNFGRLGERPTHPELLDWLAVQFVKMGWSIKAMHRLIMLSSTYQMSTEFNANFAKSDPENRLLWRMNRRRLDAESIRDSILAVAGNLDLKMGGSMLPTANRKYVTSTANVNPVTYKTNRRSVYLPIVRSALYDVFQAFDFADPSVLNGKRVSTTVAPQALFMMNSEIVFEQTESMAKRLIDDEALDEDKRVRQLFELAYSRSPTQNETDRAIIYIDRYTRKMQSLKKTQEESRLRAWQSFCRVVIASNEFVYIE